MQEASLKINMVEPAWAVLNDISFLSDTCPIKMQSIYLNARLLADKAVRACGGHIRSLQRGLQVAVTDS